jgi:iron uptake system component EfeO
LFAHLKEPTIMHRSRWLRGVAGVAGLTAVAAVAAACGSSTSDGSKAARGATPVTITLTNDGCEPSPATISAGPVTFTVNNTTGDKVSEAELLRGETIMGEKENLTPGLSGTFSLKIDAGDYTISCPDAKTDSFPFKVTGTATKTALDPAVSAKLDTAVAGYQTYVLDQVDKLIPATTAFTNAVRSGDITKAKNLFAPARGYYERVEPVAESFGDLDPQIDARVNDVDDQSAWTGFHRIEKALWANKSLANMKAMADKLDADVAKLAALVKTVKYQPAQLANGATDLLNEVASSKITGEEDRYSHTDLSDFRANIDGAKEAFALLGPALATIDPQLYATVTQRFAGVEDSLTPYRGDYAGSGFVDYSTVTDDQRKVLTQKVDALAEPLSQVAAQVTG